MGTQPPRAGRAPKRTVTVLVALYKAGKFLETKLKDLASQTIFNECTVVLLNCQNLDKESSIYRPFMDKYPNVIEIVYKSHIKLYPTWNHGIRNTRSDYICNANVDDLWHPKYLEACVKFLNQNPDFAVVSSNILVADKPNQVWPNWIWVSRMPNRAYPLSTAGPCPVWRRKLHNKYGYFGDYACIGDAKIWEKWYAGGEKFGLIDKDLVLYYLSPQSLERRRNSAGRLLRDIDLEV